ncbi:head decoration protein [Antarcticimicrobium sediminis]|uniref:Head decoration protein n=1 Tax=Antarcticimicrobium sediminis TaxID=2546227 RepID=A0A4R5EII8_9RHOB|nr:head decoration protein [Antarcticimicrobium sediminis]TDE34133.1 head decoration protein [Antarcticimicrobium sediminis]
MENATMQTRNLAFLLSEAAGRRSRSIVTIPNGEGKLAAGTVLGKVTASGEYIPSPNAEVVGKEGAETAVAVLAYGVDATDQAVEVTVIDRDAEAKQPMLSFDASVDDQTKTDAKVAQLNAVGIRVR